MGRFTKGRELLSGRAKHSQALTDTPFPVTEDSEPYRGSFIITESGEMQWSNGAEWVPLAPPGTEMMIPPWVDVPQGWFEISGKMDGDFGNRRVIANLFDFGYLEESLVTWLLPIPSNMFETSAQTIQVGLPPAPVGLALDASVPRIDWTQPVTGSRPVWRQVTRTFNGVPTTFNQITFNRVGQQFTLTIPERVRGTMIVCTDKGIIAQGVDISAGAYSFGRWELFAVEEVLIFDKYLTTSEIVAFKDFLVVERGRVRDQFATVADMSSGFKDRTDVISLPAELNLSGVTKAKHMFAGMTNLQTLPLYDLPLCQNYEGFLFGCLSLTSLPALRMDHLPVVSHGARQLFYGLAGLLTFNPDIKIPITNNWLGMFSGLTVCDNRQGADFLWSLPPQNSSNVENLRGTWKGNANVKNFAPHDFSKVEDIFEAWSGNTLLDNRINRGAGVSGTPLYSFPMCDFEAVQNAARAWYNCESLTHFPPVRFPSVVGSIINNQTGFALGWGLCTLLAHFGPNVFDQSNCRNYMDAFFGCALTATSVNNILTSIAAAAVTFDLNNGVLGMDGGTSAAPTGAGLAAKNDLIARGWTVTTN